MDRALSTALLPWRKPLAIHDPGKVIADLAIALELELPLGGDCLADIAVLRAAAGRVRPGRLRSGGLTHDRCPCR